MFRSSEKEMFPGNSLQTIIIIIMFWLLMIDIDAGMQILVGMHCNFRVLLIIKKNLNTCNDDVEYEGNHDIVMYLLQSHSGGHTTR